MPCKGKIQYLLTLQVGPLSRCCLLTSQGRIIFSSCRKTNLWFYLRFNVIFSFCWVLYATENNILLCACNVCDVCMCRRIKYSKSVKMSWALQTSIFSYASFLLLTKRPLGYIQAVYIIWSFICAFLFNSDWKCSCNFQMQMIGKILTQNILCRPIYYVHGCLSFSTHRFFSSGKLT